MKKIISVLIITIAGLHSFAQDANVLLQTIKQKLDKVNDYSATGKMKTDVVFLKVPMATVNMYFKKPNKFRVSKEKGISIWFLGS